MTRFPWQERNGRFSPLKAGCLAALFLPGLWVLGHALTGQFGPRPVKEAIDELGLWTIRYLLAALAITPLQAAWRLPSLLRLRRMIGVAAFCYALAHVAGYVVDQRFDLAQVLSETVSRIYLALGAVAVLALAPLAATSTDGMIRRLGGRNWRRLHQLGSVVAVLGTVHYFMSTNLWGEEAMVVGGLYLWLMGYRLLTWIGPISLGRLAGLSLVASALTAFGEASYYNVISGVDLSRVLAANVSAVIGIRPAVYVLGITLAVTVAAPLRAAPLRVAQRSRA